MSFDLEGYAPVQERIGEFYRDFPNGSIQTRLVRDDGPEVVFEARVFRTPDEVREGVYTSGWAREVEGKNPVNRTSHLENCESSAIGRALANLGYSKDATRPSRRTAIRSSSIFATRAKLAPAPSRRSASCSISIRRCANSTSCTASSLRTAGKSRS